VDKRIGCEILNRMKTLIVIALVLILCALGGAGVFMLRRSSGNPQADRQRDMARALALRVGLSVALFLFVLLAWRMGWIQPSGLPVSG
jgi:cell division protein FtsW (lipid II flippase)